MKHLLNHTVYGSLSYIPGDGTYTENLAAIGADGIELLTDYVPPNASLRDVTEGVHVPFAMDWRSVWNGEREVPREMSAADARNLFYGRDREGIIRNLYHAIHRPRRVDPDYGVLHACNISMDEIGLWKYSAKDADVLSDFVEMLNSVMATAPGGEPPFTIMFENLWWPGLRMLDGSGWKYLESKLEFDDWGLCLDTGHLLIACGGVSTEEEAIETIWSVVEKYPRGMKDRLSVVHLHLNLSAEYMKKDLRPEGYLEMPLNERLAKGFEIVCGADTHSTFTNSKIADAVEFVNPEFVTHEVLEEDPVATIEKFKIQRALFR